MDRITEHTCSEVKDYCCPNCSQRHNDAEGGYEIENVQYPQYSNEVKGSNMDGNYHNWDEEHRCQDCKTFFWFRNGSY